LRLTRFTQARGWSLSAATSLSFYQVGILSEWEEAMAEKVWMITGASRGLSISRFGRIDVLVNNAGFGMLGAIEETTGEDDKRIYQVRWAPASVASDG
jgi:hypothetical protein